MISLSLLPHRRRNIQNPLFGRHRDKSRALFSPITIGTCSLWRVSVVHRPFCLGREDITSLTMTVKSGASQQDRPDRQVPVGLNLRWKVQPGVD